MYGFDECIINEWMNKVIKGFKNVQLINMLSDRNLFTRHGIHMNAKGRELMVGKLIEVMYCWQSYCDVIPMAWENESMKFIDKIQENN